MQKAQAFRVIREIKERLGFFDKDANKHCIYTRRTAKGWMVVYSTWERALAQPRIVEKVAFFRAEPDGSLKPEVASFFELE